MTSYISGVRGYLLIGVAVSAIALFVYVQASARGEAPSPLPPNASDAQRAELADGHEQTISSDVLNHIQREAQ